VGQALGRGKKREEEAEKRPEGHAKLGDGETMAG
jgi:hypothetical protein